MTTDYPIKNENFGSLCSDWNDDLILPYDVKFGKKCYLRQGNSLVAIMPKALCFGQKKPRTSSSINSWHLSYVSAKDGKNYYMPLSRYVELYETPEDFVQGTLMPKSSVTVPSCINGHPEVDGFTLGKTMWRTHLRGVGYDSRTGNTFESEVPFRLWIDADGTHFETDLTVERNGATYRLYPTEAKARYSGRSESEVIDFEDEQETEYEAPEFATVSWNSRTVIVTLDELGDIADRLK